MFETAAIAELASCQVDSAARSTCTVASCQGHASASRVATPLTPAASPASPKIRLVIAIGVAVVSLMKPFYAGKRWGLYNLLPRKSHPQKHVSDLADALHLSGGPLAKNKQTKKTAWRFPPQKAPPTPEFLSSYVSAQCLNGPTNLKPRAPPVFQESAR